VRVFVDLGPRESLFSALDKCSAGAGTALRGTIMSSLKEAQERLRRALGRLEAAAENVAGREDNDDLQEELAEMRQRCELLENRSQTVSRQLDDTIGRMRQILGTQ